MARGAGPGYKAAMRTPLLILISFLATSATAAESLRLPPAERPQAGREVGKETNKALPPASTAGEVPPITPPAAAAPGAVVEPEPPTPEPVAPPTAPTGGWFVQVGAYRSRAGADRVVSELGAKGHKAFVSPQDGLNRVRVGPFADKAQADAAAAALERLGHSRPAVLKEGQ